MNLQNLRSCAEQTVQLLTCLVDRIWLIVRKQNVKAVAVLVISQHHICYHCSDSHRDRDDESVSRNGSRWSLMKAVSDTVSNVLNCETLYFVLNSFACTVLCLNALHCVYIGLQMRICRVWHLNAAIFCIVINLLINLVYWSLWYSHCCHAVCWKMYYCMCSAHDEIYPQD